MRYVVTLVHGTWAFGLPILVWLRRKLGLTERTIWTHPSSVVCQYLTEHLTVDGLAPVLLPFRWSGRNRVLERARAAEDLIGYLGNMARVYPDARQILIGHSHGGTVVLYALRDAIAEARVAGVICLGTPFLYARPRLGPFGWKCLTHGSGILFGLVGGAIALTLQVPGPPIARFLLRLALWAFVVAIAVITVRAWIRGAERMRQRLALPLIKQSRILIVRAPGDEALGVLGGLRVMGAAMGLGWGVLAWPGGGLMRFAERLGRASIGSGIGVIQRGATRLASLCLGFLAGAYLTVAGLILVPVAVLTSLILWPVGLELVPFGLLLDVTIEPSPAGTWPVYWQPRPPASETSSSLTGRGLDHSSSYDDPRALETIVDWINELGN